MENGQISRAQALYLIVMAIIGTATLNVPSPMIKAAGPDAWASSIVGILVGILSGLFWIWLARFWPGRDLFAIPISALGRFWGGAVSWSLLLWGLSIATGAVWWGAGAISVSFLPNTPMPVLIASILLPAAMAVSSGLELVSRLNQFVFWILISLIVGLIPLAAPHADLLRLLPSFERGLGPVLKGSLSIGYIVENVAILAVLPFVKGPVRAGRLMTAIALIAGGALGILTTWVIAVFGPTLPAYFPFPILLFSHIISFGEIIERADALFLIMWISGVVAKMAFWLWFLCLGVARLTGLRYYRPLVWPMGFLVGTGCLFWYKNPTEIGPGLHAWALLSVPIFGFALPLMLIGFSALRRLVTGVGEAK